MDLQFRKEHGRDRPEVSRLHRESESRVFVAALEFDSVRATPVSASVPVMLTVGPVGMTEAALDCLMPEPPLTVMEAGLWPYLGSKAAVRSAFGR